MEPTENLGFEDAQPVNEPVTELKNDDKTMAILAHAGGIFFSFIPALIIWLIKKDESVFVAEQSKEALNFQISIAIYLCACSILSILLIGIFLIPIILLINLILCILASIKASEGRLYHYPLTIRLVK